MKVISLDIGIVNLAYCIFEVDPLHPNDWKVVHWNLINLRVPPASADQSEGECVVSPTLHEMCSCKTKKGGNCSRPAKLVKQGVYYCMSHARTEGIEPVADELKPSALRKCKTNELLAIAEKYNISLGEHPCRKKDAIIARITEFVDNQFCRQLEKHNAQKMKGGRMCDVTGKKKRGDKTNWELIAYNIAHHFDMIGVGLSGFLCENDRIIVENQIGPLANKMKTVQGMITQYFVMKQYPLMVEIIDARSKYMVECITAVGDGGAHRASLVSKSMRALSENGSATTSDEGGKRGAKKKSRDLRVVGKHTKKSAASDEGAGEEPPEQSVNGGNALDTRSAAKLENDSGEKVATVWVPGKYANSIITDEVRKEYKNRKRSSVETTMEFLMHHLVMQEWKPHFEQFQKKDDLADCFLQGLWWILSFSQNGQGPLIAE